MGWHQARIGPRSARPAPTGLGPGLPRAGAEPGLRGAVSLAGVEVGVGCLEALVAALAAAGCVAPDEEAAELLEVAQADSAALERLVSRRVAGEPLAWVSGSVTFCGHNVVVDRGVYVPRWQTEPMARRAAALLPDGGLAADLCTGAGAVALVMARARPCARVLATDIDETACRCAARNGVEVLRGDMGSPLPLTLWGSFDVVTAVVPYVPTEAMQYLPRDVRNYEPAMALDGGRGGIELLARAVRAGRELLHPGGCLLLEMGGSQDLALGGELRASGFEEIKALVDDEGDLRGVEATLGGVGLDACRER